MIIKAGQEVKKWQDLDPEQKLASIARTIGRDGWWDVALNAHEVRIDEETGRVTIKPFSPEEVERAFRRNIEAWDL